MFYHAQVTGEIAVNVRNCSLCGLTKPLRDFHRRADGHQWWCKACRRTYDAAYYLGTRDLRRTQRRQRQVVLTARMRALKQDPCMDCGGRFHPVAMTFDHRPGTVKIRDLATLAQRGCTGLFNEELKKCDLVCANCHAVRTFMRREEKRQQRSPVAIREPGSPYVIAA